MYQQKKNLVILYSSNTAVRTSDFAHIVLVFIISAWNLVASNYWRRRTCKNKGKGKIQPKTGDKAHRRSRGITLSLTSVLDGVGGQHHAPAALPQGRTRYPLYRRLGRTQGRCGRVQKYSLPHGFDPRTVQPVASRYTNWAIPAPKNLYQIKLAVPNLIVYITAITNKSFSTRYYQVRKFRGFYEHIKIIFL
jgi:hypothetical protein